jgi:hypothetical protein
MSETGSVRPKGAVIAMGLLFLAVGMIPVLAMLGILPHGNAPSDPAPNWIGWAIGLMFGGGGVVIIIKGIAGGYDQTSGALPDTAPIFLRAIHDLLTVAIMCALAAVFTWVAFGPGARHFTVSGGDSSGGFATQTSGSGDILGRIAFGIGSIIFWCVTFFGTVSILRRWRR